MAYRNAPHPTTGRCPAELLTGRKVRVALPCLIPDAHDKLHDEVKMREEEKKARQNAYADKRRRAQEQSIRVGDKVLLKQTSSTSSPPWDPSPYTEAAKSNTRVTARRGDRTVSRNCEKFKILNGRPANAQPERPTTELTAAMSGSWTV